MKTSEKIFKAMPSVAGILAIASACLLVVLIFLAEIGCINPRKMKLILKTESVTREYDGETLTGGIDIVGGKLANGHRFEILAQSSLDRVGSTVNEVEFLITDSTGADVSDLYEVELDYGELVMIRRKINLKSGTATSRYTGGKLSSGVVKDLQNKLAKGDKIQIISYTELETVGSVKNQISFYIVNENGEDVTSQYDATFEEGSLTMNAIPITVKTGSETKFYDGKPLTNEDFTITSGQLVSGHEITVKGVTNAILVGDHKNQLDFAIHDEKGNDVTSYYVITQLYGTLRVEGKSLLISSGKTAKEYDGVPLENKEFVLKSGELADGHTIKLAETTSFEGVGSVDNVIRVIIVDRNGADVTNQYSISYSYGTLTVTPRRITVRTGSLHQKYDGQPVSCNTFSVSSGSLCKGDELTIVCKPRTAIGVFSNDVTSYTVMSKSADGTRKDVTECYQIVFETGTIQITK